MLSSVANGMKILGNAYFCGIESVLYQDNTIVSYWVLTVCFITPLIANFKTSLKSKNHLKIIVCEWHLCSVLLSGSVRMMFNHSFVPVQTCSYDCYVQTNIIL